jgi:hypothetical protein
MDDYTPSQHRVLSNPPMRDRGWFWNCRLNDDKPNVVTSRSSRFMPGRIVVSSHMIFTGEPDMRR